MPPVKNVIRFLIVLAAALLSGCQPQGEDNPLSYEVLYDAARHQHSDIPDENTAVYIAEAGSKYHQCTCWYVSNVRTRITLREAVEAGYTPCTVCNPPRLFMSKEAQKE